MKYVTVDAEPVDVYFYDIAEQVAERALEPELLEELAFANERIAKESKDARKVLWANAVAAKLREVAKFLKGLE